MRYTVKALPYSAFRVEETARWLEDQAANGRLLHTTLGNTGLAVFQKTAEKRVRFHVECADRGEPAAFTGDDGESTPWVYAGIACGARIYRCDDPAAVPPARDTEAELTVLRKARTWGIVSIALWLLLAGLWVYDLVDAGFWLSMTTVSGFVRLCALAAFAVVSAAEIGRVITAAQTIKRMTAQTTTDDPPKQVGGRRAAMSVIVIVLVLVMMVGAFVGLIGGATVPLEEYSKPLPVPTAEELIGGVNAERSGGASFVSYEYTLIAPTMLTYQQEGDYETLDGEALHARAVITYYETLSPWIAQLLARELTDKELMSRYGEARELDIEGLDYVAVYEWPAVAFLQKDNVVMTVDFDTWDSGGENNVVPLEEWIAVAAAYLQ